VGYQLEPRDQPPTQLEANERTRQTQLDNENRKLRVPGRTIERDGYAFLEREEKTPELLMKGEPSWKLRRSYILAAKAGFEFVDLTCSTIGAEAQQPHVMASMRELMDRFHVVSEMK
jgi:hypothetical protein